VRRAPAALVAAGLLAAAGAGTAAAAPPPTSGAAAIVVDARTGATMYAKRAAEPRPIASATKLMTALLTLERARLGDVFTAAPYSASAVESKIGLRAGERMTVRDLLTALLLESANDAAVTLAVDIAGSREAFVREMNRRAVELGLRATSYANPIGFDDPDNHSSARDLARLARVLLRNRTFARIVDLPRAGLRSGARPRLVENRNRLVASYPFVSGVKTGHTLQAGYVLVGAAEGGGARVISVTLGAPSVSARDADTLALLRWGLGQFHRSRVVEAGRELTSVPVRYRDERAPLGAASAVTLVLRRGERTTIALNAPDRLEGPIARGERVGWVDVRRGGRTVRRLPLVTLEAVAKPSLARKVTSGAGGPLTALLALGIVASAMLLVRRRRAGSR
jgi:D-alanyl-D-alanine carboxypeptidase (penicillin-binding protein 5/6)